MSAVAQLPSIAGDDARRLVPADTFRGVPSFLLDVPETIPQLGYGSHQFFRYYGKFPSIVGREIVRRHGRSGASVLDCYAGSGTTLVEAQSAGHASYGIDINPLAALACNVKTDYACASRLRAIRDRVLKAAAEPTTPPALTLMSEGKLTKWFSAETRVALSGLREALLREPPSAERRFLLLAFLGIVRRVSRAYDGEVRPHVNLKKKERSALLAFAKKSSDMIAALPEIEALRPRDVASHAVTGDNRDPETYRSLVGSDRPALIVAHPPYLNSFNYLQIFSLEFAWSEGFPEVWAGWDMQAIRAREHRGWPATDRKLVGTYYDDFRAAVSASLGVAAEGARLAVVIGDATIRGKVEPVHSHFWDILLDLRLEPVEMWFRTTHYGVGKYAYSHRADYHGDAVKRDGILFFRAP